MHRHADMVWQMNHRQLSVARLQKAQLSNEFEAVCGHDTSKQLVHRYLPKLPIVFQLHQSRARKHRQPRQYCQMNEYVSVNGKRLVRLFEFEI